MAISESQVDELINSLNKLVEAMGKQQSSTPPYAKLDERILWHKVIGGVAIASLLFLFVWVFLHMPSPADVQVAVTNGLIPVKGKMDNVNEKISNINESLARLTTASEFLKPDVSKNLPRVMKQSLQQSGDLDLGLRTVTALATKALEQKVTTDPHGIFEIGQMLLSNQNNFEPSAGPLAWDAVVSLLDYRSFITASEDPSYDTPAPRTIPAPQFPPGRLPEGIKVYRIGFTVAGTYSDTIAIDGAWWEGVTFRNLTIQYSGGPVVLRNVTFENCKFQISFSPQSKELGRAILSSNTVNIDILSG
jgi:hypothetical protein